VAIFRPSATVRLTLRTEEFQDTAALDARLPGQDATLTPYGTAPAVPPPRTAELQTRDDILAALRANAADLAALERLKDALAPEEYEASKSQLIAEREQVQAAATVRATLDNFGTGAGQKPTAVVGTPPDDLTIIGNIQPIAVTVQRNGVTTADTCNLTLDFADAPIDPRILRAAHVEVIIGIVDAQSFEDGIENQARRADGSLTSIVGKEPDGSIVGATRFVGFVDEWVVKYSDDGDRVTLDCRDMSAPMRDIRLNPGDSIDLGVPLDRGVQEFLDAVSPATKGMRVHFMGEVGTESPIPDEASEGALKARRGRKKRRGRRGDQDMTMWDHIVDVCGALGFTPYIHDFEIRIVEARTLYSTSTARRMIYGINLESLSFTRRLAGVKVPTIEVRSFDPSIGRVRWARFPGRRGERPTGVLGIDKLPPPLRANEVPPSGANPTEAIKVLIVSGVTDPAILYRVARNAFQQIGRQEIEGSLATYSAASHDQPDNDADLVDIRATDPIEVLIVSAAGNSDPDASSISTLAELQAYSRARRVEYLEGLGWSRPIARRFAALQDATAFQTVFRVQDAKISLDADDGLKIDIAFINYITVREDEFADLVDTP
jgi:hypothetical protein